MAEVDQRTADIYGALEIGYEIRKELELAFEMALRAHYELDETEFKSKTSAAIGYIDSVAERFEKGNPWFQDKLGIEMDEGCNFYQQVMKDIKEMREKIIRMSESYTPVDETDE